MIVRELWCNALDEGGAERDITDVAEGVADKTTFLIQYGIQFADVIKNWCKYFIHDQVPIYKDKTYALYPAGPHITLYKQGVLIYENREYKSVFSYDVGNADINELREFKGHIGLEMFSALHNADEKAITYFLENVTEDHYEGSTMHWDWYLSFGEAWRRVIGSGKLIYQKALDDIKTLGNHPDEKGLVIVPERLYKALTKQFDGIGALYVASKAGNFYEQFDVHMENKIKQALTILEACDYPMHEELAFVYGFFEDRKIQAQIQLDKRRILISNTLLQQPIFKVVSMLIEENEHFNTGMSDHTREFQTHFIELYTRELLKGHGIGV